MKKAVIVVGYHYAGKSKTINKYLKLKLEIGTDEHKFTRNGMGGFILSQSFEESNKVVDEMIDKYAKKYDLLVLPARPADEKISCLNPVSSRLKANAFRVSEVSVVRNNPENYYDGKADEILRELDR